MPAHHLTLDEHALLVEAFRAAPGNVDRAAKAAGVGWPTAKRYWTQGAPDCGDIRAKPISEIIREEQELTRARLRQLEEEVTRLAAEQEAKRRLEVNAAAQKDATDARVAEGQLVRMARGGAAALLAAITAQSKGAARISQKVGKQMEKMAADPADLTKTDMLDMVRTVAALTTALRQANDAAAKAMEMERLLLGEPTSITAHVHVGDVSVEEAERRLQLGMRALERAKAKGLIVDGKVLPHHAALPTGTAPLSAHAADAEPDQTH